MRSSSSSPDESDSSSTAARDNFIALRKHTSDLCSHDIKSHGLIDHARFPEHKSKEIGVYHGCIFEGRNKHGRPKTVYVKQYKDRYDVDTAFDINMDYVVLKMLKLCGARAPKVKLVTTEPNAGQYNYYLFSTNIAHARTTLQDKAYHFRELSHEDFMTRQLVIHVDQFRLRSKSELFPEKFTGFKRAYHLYPIDKRSTARLLILSLLFQLTDLHEDNIGFVISSCNGEIKAKLAFIDFAAPDHHIQFAQAKNLKELVFEHYNVDGVAMQLLEIIMALDDEEYVEAFKDIGAAGFVRHCDYLTQEILDMPSRTDQMKSKITRQMATVKDNFHGLFEFISNLYRPPADVEVVESLENDNNRKSGCFGF